MDILCGERGAGRGWNSSPQVVKGQLEWLWEGPPSGGKSDLREPCNSSWSFGLVPVGCAAGRRQRSEAVSSQGLVDAHLDECPGTGGTARPGEMLGTGGDNVTMV